MILANLFNFKYLFALEPAPLHPLQQRIALVFLILFSIGAIITLWLKVKKRIDAIFLAGLSRLLAFFLTIGLLGWFFYFCRQEGVYLLSRRFWLLGLTLGAIIWLLFLAKYLLVVLPQQRKKFKVKQEFEKYLPKKKN